MNLKQKFAVFFGVIVAISLVALIGYVQLRAQVDKLQTEQVATMTKETTTVTPLVLSPAKQLVQPVSISIPRLGVHAPVKPVGLDLAGRMATIPNPHVIAWYAQGAAPGAPGNAILAGHRDWNGVLGTFWSLESLAIGSHVKIHLSNGSDEVFQVTSNHAYPANAVPSSVMSLTGPTRTTLITCVGDFVRSAGGYQSRVVVILQKVTGTVRLGW